MQRFLALGLVGLWLGASGAPAAADEAFPKPPQIAPRVAFWKRVYTEVGTDGGLIHDAADVALVYEVVSLPRSLSPSARERKIRQRKAHYEDILSVLAKGKRSGLDAEQTRVLRLFGETPSRSRLREARRQVRFQLGQADKFRDGVIRMGRWEDYIRGVLSERGLPPGLVALPHVESSYNPEAHSHAGASGLWQFTRSTGRLFMRVDHIVDERRDPFLSSVAAARLLKKNYELTGSWPLAITAYNHGAAGMQRAIRKLGTRDIAAVLDRYDGRSFGFASRNFYCEFLAALEVEQEPERYFGPLRKEGPEEPEIVVLDHYYKVSTLAETFGLSPAAMRRHNPALLQPVWSGQKYAPRGYALRLPRGAARAAPKVVLASVPAGERFGRQVPDREYRVQRGDSLSRIAQRFGVSQRELVALNGLRSAHHIRAGQRLKLPVHGVEARVAAVDEPTRTPEPIPAEGLYRVRRGDSLASISSRFGVGQTDLAELNHLRNRNHIVVGQVLQIPGGAVSARPAPASGEATGVYLVQRGDTLHAIARRFDVSVDALAERNGLRDRHTLRVGQRLYVPGAAPVTVAAAAAPEDSASSGAPEADATPAAAPVLAAGAPTAEGVPPSLPLHPERYRVDADGAARVQPDETLGHLAEWLEVAPDDLRRLNGLRRGDALPLGRRLSLVFARVSVPEFEKRRLEHHRRLQQEFYHRFAVSGTREVVLQRGDTLWKIAQAEVEVPVWLILEYNPDVDLADLRVGQRVLVPRVERRPS